MANESEYRRGYADGWICAVNEMRVGKLYDRLFDFWATKLIEWMKKDEGFELPPRFKDGSK